MRDPITFETGKKMKDPKIIQREKVRSVEEGNSEGKGKTETVKL